MSRFPGESQIVVVLCTAPPEVASDLARQLIGGQLAACVNIVAEVTSVYRWEGAISEDRESLLVIKTSRDRVEELTRHLVEAHPYSVPEVIALPVAYGSEPYLRWVAEASRGRG